MSKNTSDNGKNAFDINIIIENKLDEILNPETPWIVSENCAVIFDNKISDEIIKWGTNKDLIRRQMLRKEKVSTKITLACSS